MLSRRPVALAAALVLLVAPHLASAQPAAQPTIVKLEFAEYRFNPTQIDLDHGQPYILRLVNTGERAHGFSAKAFFHAAALAPASKPWVRNGVIELPVGQSVDITLTAPDAAGSYDFVCPHMLHEMMGMKGEIVVH